MTGMWLKMEKQPMLYVMKYHQTFIVDLSNTVKNLIKVVYLFLNVGVHLVNL
jgi:hypothetical protein